MASQSYVSPASVAGLRAWYLEHGQELIGDEDTDDYFSDDEYEEDPHVLKKTRKNMVGVLRSYNQQFRATAQRMVQTDGDAFTVEEATLTPHGVFFPVKGVRDPLTLREKAGSIDPKTSSSLIHQKGSEYDNTGGVVTQSFVTQLTYDLQAIINDFVEASWWRWNFLLGLFLWILGSVLAKRAWSSLAVYFNSASKLLLGIVLLSACVSLVWRHRISTSSISLAQFSALGIATLCIAVYFVF